MAQILIDDIEDDVLETLRRRAEARDVRVEDEIRDMMREVAVLAGIPEGVGLGTQIALLFRGLEWPELDEVNKSRRP
jgi:plasmid stability protein